MIATCIEIRDGKFITKNCNGMAKAKAILENYDVKKDYPIYTYGDSRDNKEMLVLADEANYKPFRK